MSLLCYLLPDKTKLHLENYSVDEASNRINLIVSSVQTLVTCPVCACATHRIHSRYERKLADLPWADYNISLQLNVRKFFCTNSNCERRIFTERLKEVTAPWARQTNRLSQQLINIGLALGGAAGVKLSQKLRIDISRNTLLSKVRKLPLPKLGSLETLGVDDFCFRKCKTYGTIVVDLDRNRPVALLGDRSAETLALWLKDHKNVKVVSRDRAKSYERGIREGAPNAVQVADRFHLLQNLAETLYQVFGTHASDLKAVEDASSQTTKTRPDGTVVVAVPPPPKTSDEISKAQQRQKCRLSNHLKVWELRRQGLSGKAIARKLGIGCTTVFRYLRSEKLNERRERSDRGRSVLDPYKRYVLERWNSGILETKQLFQEIRQRGYSGSYDTVARYTRRLRESQGLELRQRYVKKKLPIVIEPQRSSLTPYRATWLVLGTTKMKERESERTKIIDLLIAQHPNLAEAIELAFEFCSIVRTKAKERFDSWLNRASFSNISQFRRFSKGLREDYDAVKAGVTLSISNGPVEGHINRLKMLKRQMYGRAKLDLLERRFLLAT